MSETKAIQDLVTGSMMKPAILDDKWGRQHILLPKLHNSMVGYDAQNITPKGAVKIDPAFIDQAVNLDQAQSLIDYVKRFKTESTVIFADLDELQVVAAIDYHEQGSASAGLNEHHAVLKLSHSQEWETWTAISGRMYDQKAFARLLDINSDDIADPKAASLLEMVLDLNMTTSVTVQRKLAGSGTARGEGGVTRKVDGTVLPAFFTLDIPVFTGEMPVPVKALTLDNIDGNTGKLSLGLDLVRTRIIVEQELARIARAIAKETSVPVMMGSLAVGQ